MTSDEAVKRWEAHVAGVIALGSAEFRASIKAALATGSIAEIDALGEVLLRLGEQSRRLIRQLYNDFTKGTENEQTNASTTPSVGSAVPTGQNDWLLGNEGNRKPPVAQRPSQSPAVQKVAPPGPGNIAPSP